MAGVFSISQQPGIYHFAGPTQVQAVRRELSSKPDLVFVFRLGAMAAVLRSRIYLPRMFFDVDDVEYRVRMRTALERPIWPGKLVYCSHAPAMLAAEWRGARRSKATFVCSDDDARHLRRLGFGSKALVIPNALPLPAPGVNSTCPETLLYIGSFRHKPNCDGAERLLTKIWPLIRARNPSAKLIIAGKQPEQIPGFNDSLRGVEFTGFVSDLGALDARSRVVVCSPSMGWTRMKLIEAASCSKPMVSTRIGAEGLDLTNGVDILLRDDDRSFAEACSGLLDDALPCAKLGNAARNKVTRLYNASRVQCRIADIMLG
jgi:glycosyltransferase involved in cell wall biosynthesis